MNACLPVLPLGSRVFIIFFSLFIYYDSVTSSNYHKNVLPNGMWGKWMLDLCHQSNWSHFWPHLSSPLQANFFKRGIKWSASLPVNGTSNCEFAPWQSLSVPHVVLPFCALMTVLKVFCCCHSDKPHNKGTPALLDNKLQCAPYKMGSWVKLRCRNIYT